jgi:hypothetical protein
MSVTEDDLSNFREYALGRITALAGQVASWKACGTNGELRIRIASSGSI